MKRDEKTVAKLLTTDNVLEDIVQRHPELASEIKEPKVQVVKEKKPVLLKTKEEQLQQHTKM